MEIDDNIAGPGMSPLDTAVFLARRKRVYEKLHPETAAGAFKGNQHTGRLVADTMSFTTSTAEQFGLTDRHVRRVVAAGEALDDGDIEALRAAPRPVTLKDLAQIAKLGDPEDRRAVCLALSAGELAGSRVKSAAQAIRVLSDPDARAAAVNDPVEQAFKALLSAWHRAPKAARMRFAREEKDQLVSVLQSEALIR
ncbi:MAG: hypothetical protein QNJ16_15910 [Rhodobacter sp.]|nr:hypothetical protein [Rhodobacter sp.]